MVLIDRSVEERGEDWGEEWSEVSQDDRFDVVDVAGFGGI